MDREEAHKLLGLYVGATAEHIRKKFDVLSAELRSQLDAETAKSIRAELQARLESLVLARDVALADDNTTPSLISPATRVFEPEPQTAPAKGLRGPLVVLVLVVGIVLIASTSLLGIWYFDRQHEALQAEREHDQTTRIRDAWDKYRASQGLDQTPDGQRAEETLERAERTMREGYPAESFEEFKTAQDLYVAALKAENARLAMRWNNEVVEAWKQELKDRFPFNPEAETDADMADVESLFHPNRGVIWQIASAYDELQVVQALDRTYVVWPDGLPESLASAGNIRDALFRGGSDHVDVPFSVRLLDEEKLVVVALETCGVTITSLDENFAAARWTPETAGARLGARKRGGDRPSKQPELDLQNSEWGLLHVLTYGEYRGVRTDGIHRWEFKLEAEGRLPRALEGQIQMKLPSDSSHAFMLSIYSNFQPK